MHDLSALFMVATTLLGVISIPVVLTIVLYQLLLKRTKKLRWYLLLISTPGVFLGLGFLTFFLRGVSPLLEQKDAWFHAYQSRQIAIDGKETESFVGTTKVTIDGKRVRTESKRASTN